MRLTPVVLGVVIGFAATPALARFVDIEDVRAMAFDRGIVRLEEIELKRKKGTGRSRARTPAAVRSR
jgi:hypothetical protein